MKDIRNACKNFVENLKKGTILRTKCRPRSENVRGYYILGKMGEPKNKLVPNSDKWRSFAFTEVTLKVPKMLGISSPGKSEVIFKISRISVLQGKFI
jgi:hypothetical protein